MSGLETMNGRAAGARDGSSSSSSAYLESFGQVCFFFFSFCPLVTNTPETTNGAQEADAS